MEINLPNGSEVEEIILPNGSNASEVIGPDGSTVWTFIPDNAIYYGRLLEDDWIEGYSEGNGEQSKEEDHLYLYGSDADDNGVRTYVSDGEIDLSDITEVEVRWEILQGDDGYGALAALNDQNDGPISSEERIIVGERSETTDTLDVSNLSGMYYISVHAWDSDNGNADTAEVEVYEIGLNE